MNNSKQHRALYAAYDVYPTSKGAATHIRHMFSALTDYYGSGILFSLGKPNSAPRSVEQNQEFVRFNRSIPNYLSRALAYTEQLHLELKKHPRLEMVHYRDIWSGLAIDDKTREYHTIFEVNGLPSIELPYRYGRMQTSTLKKIRTLENSCLANADQIICPSKSIEAQLISRGIPATKVRVLPNAAEFPPEFNPEIQPQFPYLVYFGALQPWQGVDNLLKAFALLKDLPLRLMIIAATPKKTAKGYIKLAEQLGVSDRIIWKFQLEKADLNAYIRGATLSIAPLKECTRNVEQGCSPLKIFESLACGTPVIASDLPVVQEIITDKETGYLVAPDRHASLARTIRFLFESPDIRHKLAVSGIDLIKSRYNWTSILDRMSSIYDQATHYGQYRTHSY